MSDALILDTHLLPLLTFQFPVRSVNTNARRVVNVSLIASDAMVSDRPLPVHAYYYVCLGHFDCADNSDENDDYCQSKGKIAR